MTNMRNQVVVKEQNVRYVLDLLRRHGADGLSTRDIQSRLRVSDGTIRSYLKTLREEGYRIESNGDKPPIYRLVEGERCQR